MFLSNLEKGVYRNCISRWHVFLENHQQAFSFILWQDQCSLSPDSFFLTQMRKTECSLPKCSSMIYWIQMKCQPVYEVNSTTQRFRMNTRSLLSVPLQHKSNQQIALWMTSNVLCFSFLRKTGHSPCDILPFCSRFLGYERQKSLLQPSLSVSVTVQHAITTYSVSFNPFCDRLHENSFTGCNNKDCVGGPGAGLSENNLKHALYVNSFWLPGQITAIHCSFAFLLLLWFWVTFQSQTLNLIWRCYRKPPHFA